jgi:hypothetical protein
VFVLYYGVLLVGGLWADGGVALFEKREKYDKT